jgi:hypothetical protein
MIKYLLVLILLVLVMGPLGLALGLGGGLTLLLILAPLMAFGALMRGLIDRIPARGPERLPGMIETGDRVQREADGWYCIVEDERYGPWSDRVIAINVMKVEQRRRGKRVA